jgi:putative heme iron utilization protein
MHVECRLALNNFRDHGGQHGQESEEGKEDSQEEKEVVLQELHKTRIVSESVMPFVARTSGYISRQNIR